MLVFSDRHHEGLYSSLVTLFEDRLGGEIFYPLGMEWYPDYWAVYPHIDTARQYLSLDQLYRPKDGTPPLNQIIEKENRIYLVQNIDTKLPIKGISLEKFKELKFDILIASMPQHIEPFKKLISQYQPQAKLIFQVGNDWLVDSMDVKNVMASARLKNIPNNINYIEYHQEFLTQFYYPVPPKRNKKIYSFINCLNIVDIYKKDWELFLELEKLLPEFEFKSFGGQCRDSVVIGASNIAEKTREADFIFHCKNQGDGYSYGMFTAASCGRPLITRYSDYKDKLAGPLIGITTSITVDDRTPQQVAEEIKRTYNNDMPMVHPSLEQMSLNINEKFKEICNFDQEEQKIRTFLDNLI